MSKELTKLFAAEIVRLVREKKVSPVEVITAHLKRIEKINPSLNAIVTLAPNAVERAKEIEAQIMRGDACGSLCGVPVTTKDTIATKDLRTTFGSKRMSDNIPNEDADVVSLLKKEGAIVIGKTNTAELAMSLDCENPLFGRTNNPHDLTKTSGGSSGGDAVAVAENMTSIGIGSDLMGSIRVPSHFCGVYGLKPTSGNVSMRGHFPNAQGVYSLGSVIGPIAKSIDDLQMAFSVMAIGNRQSAIGNQKIAFYTDNGIAPVSSEIKQAVLSAAKDFSNAGFVVEEKCPPSIERSAELWQRLFLRGALTPLNEIYYGHEEEAGDTVRAIFRRLKTSEQSLDDFLNAWNERDKLREQLIEWMSEYQLILAPVGSVPAFEHGARKFDVEGQTINQTQAFSYCQTWNVFGFPALSMPMSKTKEGLPIGIQIIGRPFCEDEILKAALRIKKTKLS